jgi:hypothetical protein
MSLDTTYFNRTIAGAAGDISYAINPYAMAEGISQLRGNLVVGALATNYSQEARNQGTRFSQNVRVPKWGSLTVNSKVPGTAVTYDQPTMDKVDIPIDTHKTVDILIEDFGGLFTPTAKVAYAQEAGSVLAEAMEDDIIAMYASASKVLGGVNQEADADFIADINYWARVGKWRAGQGRNIVWGSRGEQQLLKSDTLQTTIVQGGDQSALRNAFIGSIYKFDNYVSNAMPAYTGSPNAEHGMAFQREALGVVFMDMSLESAKPGVQITPIRLSDDNGNLVYSMRSLVSYNQDYRGEAISFDTIYGLGVVNDLLLFDLVIGDY